MEPQPFLQEVRHRGDGFLKKPTQMKNLGLDARAVKTYKQCADGELYSLPPTNIRARVEEVHEV